MIWLELHSVEGVLVLINIRNITRIVANAHGGTDIYGMRDQILAPTSVTESYDEIKKYLEQARPFPRWESEFDA